MVPKQFWLSGECISTFVVTCLLTKLTYTTKVTEWFTSVVLKVNFSSLEMGQRIPKQEKGNFLQCPLFWSNTGNAQVSTVFLSGRLAMRQDSRSFTWTWTPSVWSSLVCSPESIWEPGTELVRSQWFVQRVDRRPSKGIKFDLLACNLFYLGFFKRTHLWVFVYTHRPLLSSAFVFLKVLDTLFSPF